MISWIKIYFDRSWLATSYRVLSLGNRLLIVSPFLFALGILAILEEAGIDRSSPISLVVIVAGLVGMLAMGVFSHFRWFVGAVDSNALGPSSDDEHTG